MPTKGRPSAIKADPETMTVSKMSLISSSQVGRTGELVQAARELECLLAPGIMSYLVRIGQEMRPIANLADESRKSRENHLFIGEINDRSPASLTQKNPRIPVMWCER